MRGRQIREIRLRDLPHIGLAVFIVAGALVALFLASGNTWPEVLAGVALFFALCGFTNWILKREKKHGRQA